MRKTHNPRLVYMIILKIIKKMLEEATIRYLQIYIKKRQALMFRDSLGATAFLTRFLFTCLEWLRLKSCWEVFLHTRQLLLTIINRWGDTLKNQKKETRSFSIMTHEFIIQDMSIV